MIRVGGPRVRWLGRDGLTRLLSDVARPHPLTKQATGDTPYPRQQCLLHPLPEGEAAVGWVGVFDYDVGELCGTYALHVEAVGGDVAIAPVDELSSRGRAYEYPWSRVAPRWVATSKSASRKMR